MEANEYKELLFKDLSARLLYGVICDCLHDYHTKASAVDAEDLTVYYPYCDEWESIEYCKPYLRPMSSMTDEEKEDLLITLLGKNNTKYFQVLQDGSIDNNDTAHQDLSNFNIHWINFDGVNTSIYIDWCNKNHFDYRGLIERGLAIKVTEDNNPYKN